jgi:hypothetical protein
LLALSTVAGPRPLRAESVIPEAGPATSLLERIGSPADPRAVKDALREADRREQPPVLLAQVLGYAGGAAALDGLSQLVRARDETVRITALDAAVRVGLRGERVREAAVEFARDRRGPEQLAAITALGVVGDGRDLDFLLALAEGPDARVRREAFRALGRLTGARIPYEVARWAWHCRVLGRRADARLETALLRIDESPESGDVEALLGDIARDAWLDLPRIRRFVHEWSTSTTEPRRRFACRLVGALRLADEADTIRSVRLFAVGEALQTEADRTLAILGCRRREP